MNDKILTIKKSTLVDIANEVRAKTGSTDLIKVADLDDAVAELSGGSEIIEVDELPTFEIKWSENAEPVPNNGYIENIYFNTSISDAEVEALLAEVSSASGGQYVICSDESQSNGIIVMCVVQNGMNLAVIANSNMNDIFWVNETAAQLLSAQGMNLTAGWQKTFSNPYNINITAVSNGTAGLGDQNDKLTSLVTITPVEVVEGSGPKEGVIYYLNNNMVEETINAAIPSEEGSVISAPIIADGSKFDEVAFNLVDSIIMGDESKSIVLAYQDESTNMYIATYWGSGAGWHYYLYINGEEAADLWEFSKNNDGTRSMIFNGMENKTSPTALPIFIKQTVAPEGVVVGEYNELLSGLFYVKQPSKTVNIQTRHIYIDGEWREIRETSLKKLIDYTKSCSHLFYRNNGITDAELSEIIDYNDTSNAESAAHMFSMTDNITTIPELAFSNVQNTSHMFFNCTALTTIPELDFSNVVDASSMFYQCQALTTIPELDFSNVVDASGMFYQCQALTTIPELAFSNVQNTSHMFFNCTALTTIPELDFSNVVDASSMFSDCSNLESVPNIFPKPLSHVDSMFADCTKLIEVPPLDISRSATANWLFCRCSSLVTIPELDLNSIVGTTRYGESGLKGMFDGCVALTNIALRNIRQTLQLSDGSTYGNNLTVDSLVNTCKECIKPGSSYNTPKLIVGSVNYDKLADVYVKFTDSSVTTISSDEKGDVIVCESTDEGAMTIKDYMGKKLWTLTKA